MGIIYALILNFYPSTPNTPTKRYTDYLWITNGQGKLNF